MLKKHEGFLSTILLVFIIVMAFLAVTINYLATRAAQGINQLDATTNALFFAESGLEDATHQLLQNNIEQRKTCLELSQSRPIQKGEYFVQASAASYISEPTVLSSYISENATIIPVESTKSYQTAGRIMIDRELINYSQIDDNNFMMVQRGVDGTIASAHAAGTRIGQFNCILKSIGGIPTIDIAKLSNTGGRRILTESIQLPEIWAAGEAIGTILRYHPENPATAWNNLQHSATQRLNSISILSYVDGWAVGDNAGLLHWDGHSWDKVSPPFINSSFKSVYCSSAMNCHLAGSMTNNTNTPTLADWNGSQWVATGLKVPKKAGDQLAIHCADEGDCWSVGNTSENNDSAYFYHWNGKTWQPYTLASTANAGFPYKAVSCPSRNLCWAVGSGNIFAKWDGKQWSFSNAGISKASYQSIYCNNQVDCWAVGGSNNNQWLIQHWDGVKWSTTSPDKQSPGILMTIHCSRNDDCWAAGAINKNQGVIAHWDGDSWNKLSMKSIAPINGIATISPGHQPFSAWSQEFG